jgi:Predicted acyltransferases
MQMMPFWSYATFTQNFLMAKVGGYGGNWLAMTWSLAVEEQFYLLFPLFVYFASARTVFTSAVLTVALAPLVCNGLKAFCPFPWTLLHEQVHSLALGAIIACIFRAPSMLEYFKGKKVALALLCVTLLIVSLSGISGGPKFLSYSFGAGMLWVLLNRDSLIATILRMRWLQFIGLISYGVYMIHQPIRGLSFWLTGRNVPLLSNPTEWGINITALFATILLASVSYFLIEKRFLSLGRKANW